MGGRLRVRAHRVRHCCAQLQLPACPGRVRRRVGRAPWPVGDCRQAVGEGADDLPHRADAPASELPPAVLEVEAVELALVGHVRVRPNDLADVRVPDVVRGRALDGRPANEARLRHHRHRCRLPAHVEPERLAPRGRATRRDGADVGVERVRLAGEPRQDEVDRRCRNADGCDLRRDQLRPRAFAVGLLVVGCRSGDRYRAAELARSCAGRDVRPEDRAPVERATRRELELVAGRAADWAPGERRRPREGVRRHLVGAQLEAAQPSGRTGRRSRRRGREDCPENGDGEDGEAGRTHRNPCRHRVADLSMPH